MNNAVAAAGFRPYDAAPGAGISRTRRLTTYGDAARDRGCCEYTMVAAERCRRPRCASPRLPAGSRRAADRRKRRPDRSARHGRGSAGTGRLERASRSGSHNGASRGRVRDHEPRVLHRPGRGGAAAGAGGGAWWSAAEAIAYLIKGVPLPWKEWQRAGATAPEIEQAEIDLGRAIGEGVPAWGWHPFKKRRKQIPSDHFRDEMIEKKAVPVSVAHLPKVVVRTDGNMGTSPPSRIAEYVGPLWSSIEVDSVRLKQARQRPATTQVEPAVADPASAASAAPPVNPGGRPTDRDLVLEEAGWRLRHQQVPETLAAFSRELRVWLGDHGKCRAAKTSEVMTAETIKGHVRSLWNAHKRA
jgi:hypothetical protein